MNKKLQICSIAATAIVASAMTAPPVLADDGVTDPVPASVSEPTDREIVDLPHSLSLADAVEAVSGNPEVIGYRFASDWTEGEYYLGPDMSPAEFADAFVKYYGTQAQIVGLVVDERGTQAKSARMATDLAEVLTRAADAPEFTATAPTDSHAPTPIPVDERGDVAAVAPSDAARAAAATSLWAPNYTETYSMDLSIVGYPNIRTLGTYNEWSPANAYELRRPTYMPADWGMEIDVYLQNSSLAGTRPNCQAGYQNRFWAGKYLARNETQVISWSVSKADGGAISAGSTRGSAEAYFDWDDDSDPCSSQSFAVGIGNPAGIGLSQFRDYVEPYYGVNTSVWAPRGEVGNSPMGAFYQAVSNDCNDLGSVAKSSCMGLNVGRAFPASAGSQSQMVLNPSTKYAGRCYQTTSRPGQDPLASEIDCYW